MSENKMDLSNQINSAFRDFRDHWIAYHDMEGSEHRAAYLEAYDVLIAALTMAKRNGFHLGTYDEETKSWSLEEE